MIQLLKNIIKYIKEYLNNFIVIADYKETEYTKWLCENGFDKELFNL